MKELTVLLQTQAVPLPFWGLLLFVHLSGEDFKIFFLDSLLPHTFLYQVQRITHLDWDKYDKNKYYWNFLLCGTGFHITCDSQPPWGNRCCLGFLLKENFHFLCILNEIWVLGPLLYKSTIWICYCAAICPVSDLYYAPQISRTQYQNTLSLKSILCIYISLYMYTFLYIYVYIFQNKEVSWLLQRRSAKKWQH